MKILKPVASTATTFVLKIRKIYIFSILRKFRNSVKVSSSHGFKFILVTKTLHEENKSSSSKPSLNHFLRWWWLITVSVWQEGNNSYFSRATIRYRCLSPFQNIFDFLLVMTYILWSFPNYQNNLLLFVWAKSWYYHFLLYCHDFITNIRIDDLY